MSHKTHLEWTCSCWRTGAHVAFSMCFEIRSIALVSDNEHKILHQLSATKPLLLISKSIYHLFRAQISPCNHTSDRNQSLAAFRSRRGNERRGQGKKVCYSQKWPATFVGNWYSIYSHSVIFLSSNPCAMPPPKTRSTLLPSLLSYFSQTSSSLDLK